MSFSGLQSFNDNYKKDSFNDRVCDDLSEVILQFLPFEDKVRLECVSKQFQRTIFQKHYDLKLTGILEKSIKSKALNLEGLLQKLANIKTLIGDKDSLVCFLEDPDIQLVIDYCNNVSEIHCNFYRIPISTKQKFADKFGPKVVRFSAKPKDIEMIAKYFPNIEELSPTNFHRSFMTSEQMSGVILKRLKKLSIRFNEPEFKSSDDFQSFKTFIENHKSLTHLKIEVFIETERVFGFVFKQISNLKDLIELNIKFANGVSDKILTNCLEQLSLNCQKLKSLTLSWVQMEETSKQILFVKLLNRFKHLKRFDVTFDKFPQIRENFDPFKSMNESFDGLDLTHLRISLENYQIGHTLIQDIDKKLPKLEQLSVVGLKIEPSEDTPDILSRLSNLKRLTYEIVHDQLIESLRDIIHSKVMENCKKIISIQI